MSLTKAIRFAAALSVPLIAAAAPGYRPSAIVPPKPLREFRGVWIATVANIDWPSKPGLSTMQQKGELLAILDRAARLKLNAVIFQVRPECDAMYASKIEPWSEYLTGRMGRAPSPYYDPLAFAIQEAHKRGLELHAWFNPYRALHFSNKPPIAPNHITRTHPQYVRRCGRNLWLDPGEPAVQNYSLRVIMDVVRRYDIDGVTFDDYFYPDMTGTGESSFPDDASWRKYGMHSGLSRADWRRRNVNVFIQRVYQSIKAVKPWVKFGISPFGIWRPGHPPQIKGKDAYAQMYADSRKWLREGWVDYFAPQLYWPIEQKAQSFSALLRWWAQQNPKGRHLWPSIASYKAKVWRPNEIPDQIRLTRHDSGVGGYLLYNASSIMSNTALDRALERINAQPALVPASPWLERAKLEPPAVSISRIRPGEMRVVARAPHPERTRWWVFQTRHAGKWSTQILPGRELVKFIGSPLPDVIAVTRIDRCDVASKPVVLAKSEMRTRALRSPHERSLRSQNHVSVP